MANSNDINLPRGTSFSFGIVIQTDNGMEYELQNGEKEGEPHEDI